MQRSLVKMEKLIKTNQEEISTRLASMALSEREEYNHAVSGVKKSDKKTPQAPKMETPNSLIDQVELFKLIFFYLVFYIGPMFILPLFLNTKSDYLVSSEMFIQPFNDKVLGYVP